MSQIMKIWGERHRIFKNDKVEIDLLKLKQDSFCSTHTHKDKVNRFIVVSGTVKIYTEYGVKILTPFESFEVSPPLKHKFLTKESAIMIEIAYVNDGRINPEDIKREILGGLIIDGKGFPIDELRKKGLLDKHFEEEK